MHPSYQYHHTRSRSHQINDSISECNSLQSAQYSRLDMIKHKVSNQLMQNSSKQSSKLHSSIKFIWNTIKIKKNKQHAAIKHRNLMYALSLKNLDGIFEKK